jgi:hypothetical protein
VYNFKNVHIQTFIKLVKTEKAIPVVKSFLHNNRYSAPIITIANSDKMAQNTGQGNEENTHGDNNKEEWITFTYGGKEVQHLAKLLKGTNIKRAYETTTTTEKILAYKNDGRDRQI